MIEMDIETGTVCNAACHFCPYPTTASHRAGPVMPMDLFRKIIDDAAAIPQITVVRLNGLNEPLLDRFIVDRYAYMKGKFDCGITTNGVYLTPERVETLRAAGVDHFVISLNAVRPDQHEAIMGLKGKFERVCSNIDSVIATGMPVEVRAICSRDRFTDEDQRIFLDRWGHYRYGGHGKLIKELNWTGLNRTINTFDPSSWCIRATNNIFVRHDGAITTCCADPYGNGYVFGNLATHTIREIYNSPAYVSFREDHSNNQADRHPICKVCTRA